MSAPYDDNDPSASAPSLRRQFGLREAITITVATSTLDFIASLSLFADLFYYIIGTAWGVDNKVVAGIIILSTFAGAYIAEIVRASYESLPKGPLEAARALGLTRLQCAVSVALPQMVTRTLPALTGQFASIIKDSSLLSVIAVIELTQTMREISATNYNFFGCFLLLGALYLCLTLPIMFISRHFEKRLSYTS